MPEKNLGESRAPLFADVLKQWFLFSLHGTSWQTIFFKLSHSFYRFVMGDGGLILIDMTLTAHGEN